MDRVHLFDIDMRNFIVLGKVEACVVAPEAWFRLDVATAQNAVRQENVDEAIDIERDIGRDMGWIDGDNQACPDAFSLEDFRELQRAKPAH